MIRLRASAAGFDKKLAEALSENPDSSRVAGVVKGILEDVKENGDKAVLSATEKFDGAKLKSGAAQKVSAEELEAAVKAIKPAQRKAIKESIKCVTDFHKQTLPRNWRNKNPHQATVGENFYPIERVGLYVPGGQVPLVSTVIMTSIPALVAGCPSIAICTPPRADGSIDEHLLAAISLSGLTEVYKIGGVQAIAAMAYGTRTVPAVNKIAGPGNAYVIEAKRQLFGKVGIDLLPGPSEVMVSADDTANPAYAASELLAQAEHGTGKESVYLAAPARMIDAIVVEISRQLPSLSHADAIKKVLDTHFTTIEISDYDDIVKVTNIVAPEHLQLMVDTRKQETLARQITTAGAILLGNYTPTVLGDFTAGPSHTLPTGGTGRFSSGLQVSDFMRRTSIVRYNTKNLEAALPTVREFSKMEQLDAHGNSLELRVK